MNNSKKAGRVSSKAFFVFFLVFFLAVLAFSVIAQSDLPSGLQKIVNYNNQQAIEFAASISFFIAFIAGILNILSPCILPFLPAYFSYTFKEKKNITWMTGIFFLGFSLVFVTMGAIVGFVGDQTLAVIQKGWLVSIAGVFMIILGVISLRGKKICSYLESYKGCKNDTPGTFLFGMFFAIGWTACLGPILAGILGIGAILGNIWYAMLLLFFYSLGNFVPLFILSIFYDKSSISKSKFLQGKIISFSLAGKKFHVHSTNLISGILFIAIGVVLLVYRGTAVFNSWDIFGTKTYFYSIQRQLMVWKYSNILGIVLFIAFLVLLWFFLKKNNTKNRKK